MVLGETYIIYKALGVGIVKQKSIYKNGRVSEFLLKEKRLPDPPFQINIKQPANQGSLLKTKPRDNTDRIVYNVYGQKISRNSLNSSNTQAGVYFVADKTKDGFVNVGKVVVN